MECKMCGADMRIIGSQKTEKDDGIYRVLVHQCMNSRCTNRATAETSHRIGDVVKADEKVETGES